MKARPYIELSERDTILRQLRRTGKWTTRRDGSRVRLWTRQYQEGLRICWQVFPKKHTTVNGICSTICEAIRQVNNTLHPVSQPKSWSKPLPAPPVLPVASMREQWLPYADN